MTDLHRTDRNPAAPDSGGARELVAEVLAGHDAHVGWGGGAWFVECLNVECRFSAHGTGSVADANAAFLRHLADALLASPQFARLIAEAKAEALREAARDWDALLPDAEMPGVFARWLHRCADALPVEAAQ